MPRPLLNPPINYYGWNKLILRRDKWQCQKCLTKKKPIHTHHIKSYIEYPKLRLNLDNGITLCIDCHKKTSNYGKPLNVLRKQYEKI